MIKSALLILLYSFYSSATDPKLIDLRNGFVQAPKSKEVTTQLLLKINQQNEKSNLILGYRGALTMIMAKYQLNPFSKLSYFNTGKQLLEESIKNDSKKMELLFIRFSIQTNSPSFLNYNQNIESDKKFLLLKLPSEEDVDLKIRIKKFLQNSTYLSASERNAIH